MRGKEIEKGERAQNIRNREKEGQEGKEEKMLEKEGRFHPFFLEIYNIYLFSTFFKFRVTIIPSLSPSKL